MVSEYNHEFGFKKLLFKEFFHAFEYNIFRKIIDEICHTFFSIVM